MPLPIAAILGGIEIAMKLIPVIEKGIAYVTAAFKTARAAGAELTPEQEAAYQRFQAQVLASPAAQIEPDPT